MIIRLPVKEVVCSVYIVRPVARRARGERKEKKKRKRARSEFYLARPWQRSRGVTQANLSNYLIVEHLVVSRHRDVELISISLRPIPRSRLRPVPARPRFPDKEPAAKYCRAGLPISLSRGYLLEMNGLNSWINYTRIFRDVRAARDGGARPSWPRDNTVIIAIIPGQIESTILNLFYNRAYIPLLQLSGSYRSTLRFAVMFDDASSGEKIALPAPFAWFTSARCDSQSLEQVFSNGTTRRMLRCFPYFAARGASGGKRKRVI